MDNAITAAAAIGNVFFSTSTNRAVLVVRMDWNRDEQADHDCLCWVRRWNHKGQKFSKSLISGNLSLMVAGNDDPRVIAARASLTK